MLVAILSEAPRLSIECHSSQVGSKPRKPKTAYATLACLTLLSRRCEIIVANSLSSEWCWGWASGTRAPYSPPARWLASVAKGLFERVVRLAGSIGLPVTFHALRHTHASHLIDAGIGCGEDQPTPWARLSGHYAASVCPSISEEG
jgi:hypothetical protein